MKKFQSVEKVQLTLGFFDRLRAAEYTALFYCNLPAVLYADALNA